MKNNRKNVYLAILNLGWIRSEQAMLISNWVKNAPYNLYLAMPARKPIENNRNMIVKEFLEFEPKMDYLMMMDDDIVPPIDVFNLVDYLDDPDIDIIGGPCFGYKNESVIPFALEYYRDDEDGHPRYRPKEFQPGEQLTEVDALGTGHIIISREVLEHPDMKHPFKNYYDEDGIRYEGLDLSFCRRAKEAGFKVWTHLKYACSHWVEQDLKEIYKGLVGARELREIRKGVGDASPIKGHIKNNKDKPKWREQTK